MAQPPKNCPYAYDFDPPQSKTVSAPCTTTYIVHVKTCKNIIMAPSSFRLIRTLQNAVLCHDVRSISCGQSAFTVDHRSRIMTSPGQLPRAEIIWLSRLATSCRCDAFTSLQHCDLLVTSCDTRRLTVWYQHVGDLSFLKLNGN